MQAAAMATLLGTATVVAGCGNTGSSGSVDEPVSTSGPATTEDAGSGIRACTLLSLDEVEALAGSAVTAGPTTNNGRDGCGWTAEVVEDGARSSHVIDLQLQGPSVTLDQALTIEGEPAPVEGLGDEAAIEQSTANVLGVMAGYRDEERVVTLLLYQAQEITSGAVDPRSRADALVETLRIVHTRLSTPT